MALRKGLFVSLVAVGLAKGLLPLDSAAVDATAGPLTAAEQARYLRSPTADVVGDAMSALIAATACDDRRLLTRARSVNDAALTARGLKPAHDMAAEAKTLIDTQPALRKSLVADCARSLKEAEARLDRHGR